MIPINHRKLGRPKLRAHARKVTCCQYCVPDWREVDPWFMGEGESCPCNTPDILHCPNRLIVSWWPYGRVRSITSPTSGWYCSRGCFVVSPERLSSLYPSLVVDLMVLTCCFLYSRSVSYTHLDVYKRQPASPTSHNLF